MNQYKIEIYKSKNSVYDLEAVKSRALRDANLTEDEKKELENRIDRIINEIVNDFFNEWK